MTKAEFKKQYIKDQIKRKKKAESDLQRFRDDSCSQLSKNRGLGKNKRFGQF